MNLMMVAVVVMMIMRRRRRGCIQPPAVILVIFFALFLPLLSSCRIIITFTISKLNYICSIPSPFERLCVGHRAWIREAESRQTEGAICAAFQLFCIDVQREVLYRDWIREMNTIES